MRSMMRTTWTFHSAGQIIFGRDAAAQIGDVATSLRTQRALLVTDRALVATGLARPLRSSLEARNIKVTVFDGGEAEPSIKVALACHEVARHFHPDVLIGLGGGSNMDLAKIVAVLLTHGGHPRDYVGEGKIPGRLLPIIAVPTTAGTGSEVSGAAVLTDEELHLKVGVLSNHLRPSVALVDPLLTVSCPPKVTADSGIDALTHAVEAITAVDNGDFPLPSDEFSMYQGRHLLGECLAEKAIQLIARHLAEAVHNGQNLAAREAMHLGSLLAGLAFSNIGVALVHALEYPIGGAVHCSHGCGNGLLLPYVMEFNKPARLETMARVAELMGLTAMGQTVEAAADAAIQAVRDLRRQIGIPDRLRDIGVREAQLGGFAQAAFGIKRMLRVNPRQATAQDLEEILRAAY
jgi:alcohol dehydrogenase class IV